LIEVEMSPVQWAEAITHMNCGRGTPVTIRHVGMKRMPDCPDTNARAKIEDEFTADMRKLSKDFAENSKRVYELLQKKTALTVAEKAEISGTLDKIQNMLGSTVPFVHSQFNEAVEDTVTQAKGEIEAFYTQAIMNAGKAALGIGGEQPDAAILEATTEADDALKT
jgi:hypothetical protein